MNVPFHSPTRATARVALVSCAELLVELELTEPSLFFEHGPGSAGRFAASVASAVAA